ncbi:MAG TPA: hypothetical protein VFZ87_05325 [Gemmatimonadales bacterium]
MTNRAKLFTLLVLLAFAAMLLWSTLSSQHVQCTVAVAFAGSEGEGSASAASEVDAAREAQTTACGPLTRSMDERIACSRVSPVRRQCRAL